jgi:3-keto-disaccharide hydrolase
MKRLMVALALAFAVSAAAAEPGFISLWDGKTFNGWKKSTDNPDTFRIEDGAIVANGPRCHLFYVGDVRGGTFKDFELKVDVMTKPTSNGGIYFDTEYQAEGWPAKGFEVQVNNSHGDWRRSGGLYAVQDVKDALPDNEWFTEHIVVKGKNVKIYLNDKQVVDWTQPDGWTPPQDMAGRVISEGTFALQGHDPGSTVYYKNIRVKPLD